ncbi:hypothetical protein [Actinomadura violacea]|uniref:Uncharacterized protein n=1 Tax=Actinomadura violacea TaxID=2819934 RepID=A0ABS3RXT8_9ACTN|nr:hypothetical protein [Actinomadura violacea]MBO2461466.1 hypothetical protein [Actinomadura violacea]
MEGTRKHSGLPRRVAPTRHPLLFPAPVLVAVTDTNALASRAWHAALDGRAEELFTGLARTGRSPTFVAAHVPAELELRLPEATTRSTEQGLRLAQEALWGQIMPTVPVVDLPIRDFLHPRIQPLMRADPDLPKRLRGDVDDLGTAALAEFLAPAVILSADSVFTRFGLGSTLADTWLPTAYAFLHAAGFEATVTDTLELLEIVARCVLALGRAAGAGVVDLARRHPAPALALVAALAFVVHKAGLLSREGTRTRLRQTGRAILPLLDAASEAYENHGKARAALQAVEPYGPLTLEQALARHLARCGQPLTAGALAAAVTDVDLTAREVVQVLGRHPAFTPLPGGRYRVGRPARRPTPERDGHVEGEM